MRSGTTREVVIVGLLAWLVAACGATNAVAQDYTYLNTTQIDYGRIWCDPVYDGTNIVISCESNGGILVAKFDLLLNQESNAVSVASTNDTFSNDTIADHKHVFQDGYHYIVFSISGVDTNEGQGGYMYLVKFDDDFNRIDIATVVSNDPPTNDMLMFGDGTNLYIGQFDPGNGHLFYKYDSDLNEIDTFGVGGWTSEYDNRHVNGAVAIFHDGQCHLLSRDFMFPGSNADVYRIVFETNGTVTSGREVIMTETGLLGMVTGLSLDTNQEVFVAQYMRSTNEGGHVYNALFDTNWNYVAHYVAVTGDCNRPHSIIVSNTMYIGYDCELATYVSQFALGTVRPGDSLATYDFQDGGGSFEQTVDTVTNLATASIFDSWDGVVVDMAGSSGRAIGDTNWNVTDLSRYYEFSVVVSSDYEMAVIELAFEDLASATGPTNWQLRGDHDAYGTIIGSGATHTSWTSNATPVGLAGRGGTNTFRIYGQNASAASGSWSLDNVRLKGHIESAGWADDDGDGMANDWEYRHSGMKTGMVAEVDSDGDGTSNYEEYVADTIPLHGEQYFSVTNVAVSTGGVVSVGFLSSPARQYALQAHTNAIPGTNWVVVGSNTMGTGGAMSLADTNGLPSALYRVRVSLP